MKSKLTKFAKVAAIGLALTFTLSCSSSSDDNSGGTSSPSGGGGGYTEKGNNIDNYKKEQIGNQLWLAENLDYNVDGSKCYGGDIAKCAIYGKLYDWATAMKLDVSCNSSSCASQIKTKHQGICPSGWHIPSNDDWNVLMKTANSSCSDNSDCINAGKKLKADSPLWNNNGKGTDDFKFAALPGGMNNPDIGFLDVGDYGSWWSANENSSNNAYFRIIGSLNEIVRFSYGGKNALRSVRCVKD